MNIPITPQDTKPEKTFFIQGPCGVIEALIHIPSEPFHRIAVICHPHPLYGGTMHNNVVFMLAKTLQELNIATVKFNYRGVGESMGSYANGEGEADDLMAVINWLQKEYPHHLLWLAGFSFGSYIALKTAKDYIPEQLILVAPPVANFPITKLSWPQCPVIV